MGRGRRGRRGRRGGRGGRRKRVLQLAMSIMVYCDDEGAEE
jgi:hypothetical protein